MKKIAEFLSVRHFKNWENMKDVTEFVFKATHIKAAITQHNEPYMGRVYYYKDGNEIVATFDKVLHLKTKFIKQLPSLPKGVEEIK